MSTLEIASTTVRHSRVKQAAKQLIDIVIVLVTMPFWLPVCAVIYVAILLEDGKNPLFLQERLGKDGRIFRTFKFRTMVVNAEEVLKQALAQDEALRQEWETFFKLRKDPRITRVGNILRRTSLDELPQLVNVLIGDMVMVGPRPLPAYHHNALPTEVRELRNVVKPGITGLWQVSGRSDSGLDGMKQWDPYYVRNWSMMLDLQILVRTATVVLTRQGAY
jgi:lipopolysaccharide/colanic/teichoic acid biosynthesis glycosyltransferase